MTAAVKVLLGRSEGLGLNGAEGLGYRPFIANLPVSRPLHLAGQTAEWPSRPPDELALHTHIRKGILISAVRRIVEEDETHFIEASVLYEELLYRIVIPPALS